MNNSLGDNVDNTHRSLNELVSINAWFQQDAENERRLTLHADVSFAEERLGGGLDTTLIFKLAVKRCDIIFELPESAPFRVDPATIKTPQPLNPKSVIYKENKSKGWSLGGVAQATMKTLKISGEASTSQSGQHEQQIQSEQTVGYYNEAWKKIRGYNAWSVDGRDLDNGRLAGPVIDGHAEPRLTIVDDRSESQRLKDIERHLSPVAKIRVRCRREDIDIYDLVYKDPDKQRKFRASKYQEAKLETARGLLTRALLEEGLVAGNLVNDPYAEMDICDVAITLINSGA